MVRFVVTGGKEREAKVSPDREPLIRFHGLETIVRGRLKGPGRPFSVRNTCVSVLKADADYVPIQAL